MAALGTQRKLDTTKRSELSSLMLSSFSKNIVGQSNATQALLDILEHHMADFGSKSKPAGVCLFLGPTGTGKTKVVESFAEGLFGDPRACIRIDCAEFQYGHEIAKLVGSPPGYLGHRETHPMLTQEALNQYHTDKLKLTVLLFDEIEKASDSLWNILLGILDNAVLTLGDNRKVDFRNVVIVMTSNVGARDMANRGIGYVEVDEEYNATRLDQIAVSAAKSKFSPEFMNRLNNVVVFHTLTKEQIEEILDIELRDFQRRVLLSSVTSSTNLHFWLTVSPAARRKLLTDGYDKAYGARHLKRAIERWIERPLAQLSTSGQLKEGDEVVVDYTGEDTFDFYVQTKEAQSTTQTKSLGL
jgi:ATP-dependent Clp protease ATP-binding subunit ClpB